MKQVGLVIAASLVPVVAHADDPDPSEVKHATVVAAVGKQPCLPPAKIVVDKKQKIDITYGVALRADGTSAVVCAAQGGSYGADQSPFACFTVDPASGALASRPTKLFPGDSYRVPSACGLGYCRPKETTKPSEHGDLLALSNDGARVVRLDRSLEAAKLEVFDAKSKALQRSIPLEGGLEPADVIVHGDYIFVAAYAAGPDGGLWMYSASKGKSLGTVGTVTGDDDGGYVNISGGSYEIVDDKLIANDGGYEEATVDLATGKITTRSLPKPAACTDDAWMNVQSFDQIGDVGDGKPPAKCMKAIRAAQKTFWKKPAPKLDAGFTTIGDKRMKLDYSAKGAAVQVLDANAKKPRTVKLAVCKVK
jgi:hypothetical protein